MGLKTFTSLTQKSYRCNVRTDSLTQMSLKSNSSVESLASIYSSELVSITIECLFMSVSDLEGLQIFPILSVDAEGEFEDVSIKCIDCVEEFTWTAGEQTFFRDKQLQNPPKRCKECKKAKNRRLEAIELTRTTGKRHRIEVKAECASCGISTTVPFYPCQGRPVYCRECFASIKS